MDRHDTVNKMIALGNGYRGQIIGEATLIESIIEIFIAWYFTGRHIERGKELMNALLSTEYFNFNTKRSILCFVIKKLGENKEYGKTFHKYSKIDHTLQKQIIPLRNIVAHRKIRVTDEDVKNFDGNTIVLIGTESQDPKIFTKEFVDAEVRKSRQMLGQINNFVLDVEKIKNQGLLL